MILWVFSGASPGIFAVVFLGTCGASCAELSEAMLRAADGSTLFLFVSSVSKEIEDASDLQKRACF